MTASIGNVTVRAAPRLKSHDGDEAERQRCEIYYPEMATHLESLKPAFQREIHPGFGFLLCSSLSGLEFNSFVISLQLPWTNLLLPFLLFYPPMTSVVLLHLLPRSFLAVWAPYLGFYIKVNEWSFNSTSSPKLTTDNYLIKPLSRYPSIPSLRMYVLT